MSKTPSLYEFLEHRKRVIGQIVWKYNGDNDTHEGQPPVTFNEKALFDMMFDVMTVLQEYLAIERKPEIPEKKAPILPGDPKTGKELFGYLKNEFGVITGLDLVVIMEIAHRTLQDGNLMEWIGNNSDLDDTTLQDTWKKLDAFMNPRYEVQSLSLGVWANEWTDAEDNPLVFDNEEDAQEELADHLDSLLSEGTKDFRKYRIVPVGTK